MSIIVIDPGKGGATTGSHGKTLVEKQLTLDLATRCAAAFPSEHTVRLTRSTDVDLDDAARAAFARQSRAEVFVSIHFAADRARRRAAFSHPDATRRSEALARRAVNLVTRVAGARKGVRRHGAGAHRARLALLSPTALEWAPEVHVPACLLQVGFLGDEKEEAAWKDDDFKDEVAGAVADAVVAFLEEFDRDLDQHEAASWTALEPVRDAAFFFWSEVLALRERDAHGKEVPLDGCKAAYSGILRALSWVESRHGRRGQQRPAADPVQCGHPRDPWWRLELNGKGGSSFKTGTGKTYRSNELPGVARAFVGPPVLPPAADPAHLANPRKGHNDPNFTAETSFYWALPKALHAINTSQGRFAYQCACDDRERFLRGALGYNHRFGSPLGDADYFWKLRRTVDKLKII